MSDFDARSIPAPVAAVLKAKYQAAQAASAGYQENLRLVLWMLDIPDGIRVTVDLEACTVTPLPPDPGVDPQDVKDEPEGTDQ